MGHDTVTGGAGADTFHVQANNTLTVITDFDFSQGDHIELDHGATYTATASGPDAVISLNSGTQIVLQGLGSTPLPAGAILIA